MSSTARRVAPAVGVALVLALLLLSAPQPARADVAPSRGQEFVDRLGVDGARLRAQRAAAAGRVADEAWPAAAQAVPGDLIVTTRPGADRDLVAEARSGRPGGYRFRSATALADRVALLRVPAGEELAAARALRSRRDVVAVEPNGYSQPLRVPNDPGYPQQYAHQVTGIEAAWDLTTGSDAVRVAVLDSGMVATHPDLRARIGEQVTSGTGEIAPGPEDNDPCREGHGTWVAGVIGAIGDNGTDVAGVSWGGVDLLDVSLSPPDGEGCEFGFTDAALLAGIAYATESDADIINMSLGGQSERACPTALQTAVDASRSAGTTLIASSGNAGPGDTSTPAACNGVISVAATGVSGDLPTDYSSGNEYVDLTAPGGEGEDPGVPEGIATTSWWLAGERTGATITVQGTSFSAPYVAGVAALLKGIDPSLTPDEVESALESTAVDLLAPGRDDDTGFGSVDPTAAVALVASSDPLPAPEPDPVIPVGTGFGVRPGGDVEVLRIGTAPTTPIQQAVLASQALFPDFDEPETLPALYGVVARSDDFADALAGSGLAFGGLGPLLFTPSTGGLAPETAAELTRTLAPGSMVGVLGGPAAVPAAVDDQIVALGFEPFRFAGPAREETAVIIAETLVRLTEEQGATVPAVVLASRSVWFDAVTGGSIAANFGAPVLLTSADSLHPATAAALEAISADVLYVVGGEVRVSQSTRAEAVRSAAPSSVTVLAGATREGTAVAVAGELERIFTDLGSFPGAGFAINLTRDDGYAHALSATPLLSVSGGVYLPLLGQDGGTIAPEAADYIRGLALPTALIGGPDVISEAAAGALTALLEEEVD